MRWQLPSTPRPDPHALGRRIVGDVVRRGPRSTLLITVGPVLLVPPFLIADAAISSGGKPITPLSVTAAFVGCLPLAVRRRVPFWVLVAPLVGGIVLVLWQLRPGDTVVLLPMVALFDLALLGDRRRSIAMALVTGPCVLVSVAPFASAGALAALVVRNLLLCLLAIAAGDILGSRRLAVQRTAAARDEHTRRRLADERLGIAREVHDVVAHAMTAINVQAGVAAHLIDRDPANAHAALRAIKATSGEALRDLRQTLDVLRDPSLGVPLGPASGLHDLEPLTTGLRAANVAVELDVDAVADVAATVHSAGYRIVQEALTNAARHAAARTVRVEVHRAGDRIEIEIADDGSGGTPATPSTGSGLRGMRERVEALGGSLRAGPAPTGGWRVLAVLPVNGGAPE